MTINELNELLAQHHSAPDRDNMLKVAFALVEWMGLKPPKEGRERLLVPKKQDLKKYLVPHPLTHQHQFYRITADNEPVTVRLAVIKKIRKDQLTQYIDKETKVDFQAAPPIIQGLPSAPPYFVHFAVTADYKRLYVILNKGDQKRIISFGQRLTQTQYKKIIPLWENIGSKSKTEIADIFWKSLDLKEVNKEFYQDIKEQFDALVGIINVQQPDTSEQEAKQFAVRLIGRYIFCWFLRENDIIPKQLLASATIQAHKGQFFKKYLFHLFFNTLNEEVSAPRTVLSTGSELDGLYQNIPYLNGGLFEKHPEDRLFTRLELDAWLMAFVKVLEAFDFTVDESNSQYQQVAIDPEMLGRIFENLLASQNPETEKMANQRKAFGAFYTPREIVDYMVNESLKAHVATALLPKEAPSNMVAEPQVVYGGTLFEHLEPRQTLIGFGQSEEEEKKREKIKTKIEKFFASDASENPFDKEETPRVRKALQEVTVLDPACGSGAFPMGVLLRLMELRQIVGHGHKNTYDLKSEILSRNIYGVDIMPMAVEIARLRAWLSLVLEADYKPADRKNNFGISALPNLDFKFVCANSLVDSGYDAFLDKFDEQIGIKDSKLFLVNEEVKKLQSIREQYFDPKGDKTIKQALQKSFRDIKEYIKKEFKGAKENWKLESFLNKIGDWDPFDDSRPSSFFSTAWMFGLREGFDVVIGNPPYVQIQKLDADIKAELASQAYDTFEATGDLYQLFYEKSIAVLKQNGVLSFITSNKWMRTNYGIGSRELFSESTSPLAVIDFGMSLVFETATILTSILIAKKGGKLGGFPICRIRKDFIEGVDLAEYFQHNYIHIDNPGINSWIAYAPEEYSLIKKIENNGIRLEDWDIRINYGLKTGYNKAFIITKDIRDRIVNSDPRSSEIIKPILKGEDVSAYVPDFKELYLINSHNGLKALNIPAIDVRTDYPGVWQWLAQFEVELSNRQDKGAHWSNLRNCAYLDDFSKPKVIYPNMTKFLPFTYDEGDGYFCNDKAFILTGEHVKYLAAILNSTLWKFAFKDRFPELLGETREVRKVFFEKIPIKKPEGNYEKLLSDKVDEIIKLKKAKKDSKDLVKQVDVMVYKLYNLTHSEVKVIDPGFEMGEEEYEGVVAS